MAALPTTNLTLHCDASDTDQLSKLFVGGGTAPNGVPPIDGDAVQGWDDEGDGISDVALRYSNNGAEQRYRTCPHLMKLPCLDFDGVNDGFIAMDQDGSTNYHLSDFFGASSWMAAVAIYPESITNIEAEPWVNEAIFGSDNIVDGRQWGLSCRNVSGVKKVRGWHHSGGSVDYIEGTISTGASWIVIFWLASGSLHMVVIDNDGAEVTSTPISTGDTAALNGTVGVGMRENVRFFNGRIGEFALYSSALSGGNLTDLKDYFRDKWLGAVVEEDGCNTVEVSGAIGPLAWVHTRRLVDGSALTESFSDQFMADPAAWEGGRKPALVKEFGNSERAASEMFTGEWRGGTFDMIFGPSRKHREYLAGLPDRYFGTEPWTVKMTSRDVRSAMGDAYPVFVGPPIDMQPIDPGLGFKVTLGDIISRTLLSDEGQIPWRTIGDGMLDELTNVYEHLDRGTPEPIIYGINKRVPDEDEASQFGFCVLPTYLGRQDLSGDAWHVWLVAGHACADVPTIRVNGVEKISDEGTQWLVPHHAGWGAQFTSPYVDYVSSTYGNNRRYTLIYGKVTNIDPALAVELYSDPDACALGHKQLTVSVEGVEPVGDGSGTVITKRLLQYKHFAINYLAHRGSDSYQSGAWLTNPTWTVFDVAVEMVDEDSFDDCDVIGDARLPDSGDPLVEVGYIGAFVIGAQSGERDSARRWIADWNRSCACQFVVTRLGRMRVFMLAPTAAIKAAAPLYRDANEILYHTFSTNVGWDLQANRVPFQADFNHATGVWMTTDTASVAASITSYARGIDSDTRTYPAAPGITAAYHLARLEGLVRQDPPRRIACEAPVGPDKNGDSLAYLEVGDYFRYRHFGAVSNSMGEIRLAQIQRHQVQAGKRHVFVEGLDCEDLLDYDAPSLEAPPDEGPPPSTDFGPTEDITCP